MKRLGTREVRLIGVDGKQIGGNATKKAIDMAYNKKLDLVKVAPKMLNRQYVGLWIMGSIKYELG